MKQRPDDLEDLVVYLGCTKDNLLMVHEALETDCINREIVMNAVYGTYIQLKWIVEAMQNQLDKIPIDIIRKAGGTA